MARLAILTIRNAKGLEHEERYKEGDGSRTFTSQDKDLEVWAKGIVQYFNDTLRPHESPRTLVGVRIEHVEDSPRQHLWIKTSLTTQQSYLGLYDVMRCEGCSITGKRFGLGPFVKRDSVYRAKKYSVCSGKE